MCAPYGNVTRSVGGRVLLPQIWLMFRSGSPGTRWALSFGFREEIPRRFFRWETKCE